MKLYQRIEQILLQFRPVFSREATFEWFVLLFWGVLLMTQPPAVTSYLNALGLSEGYYHQALHWFHSSAYVLLDAYYAAANVVQPLREHGLHLISRVRISTVAYAEFSACPGTRGRGRPRKWGSKIKLQELFAPKEACLKAVVWLYGQQTTVYYQCFELLWDSPDATVLFVLTQLPDGKQIILLSSDVMLTAEQVIEGYGKRFKVEVCFRTLVHLLGGFAYQFWLKAMERTSSFPPNLCLADYADPVQHQIHQKVEAFERFVNLNAITLGVLQILALELPQSVWNDFPRWFRTLPKHGYPTEQIVRLTIQHQLPMIFSRSRLTLLLPQLLASKTE